MLTPSRKKEITRTFMFEVKASDNNVNEGIISILALESESAIKCPLLDRGLLMCSTNNPIFVFSYASTEQYGKACLVFLVGYVGGNPWWPIQSPNKGRKKKAKSLEESVIRSSLFILDLNDGKL